MYIIEKLRKIADKSDDDSISTHDIELVMRDHDNSDDHDMLELLREKADATDRGKISFNEAREIVSDMMSNFTDNFHFGKTA